MNRKIICLSLLLCIASQSQAQHILQILINNQDVTTAERWAIHPHDRITLKLLPEANNNYEFDKVTFELLVKDGDHPDKENTDRTRLTMYQESQSTRIRHVRESDIYNLLRVDRIRNSQYTQSFTIDCYKFSRITHFSRFIIHIKKVKRVNQNEHQNVDLDSLGDYDKFFSDGISFWAGEGFL
jgi:hypothetical protein